MSSAQSSGSSGTDDGGVAERRRRMLERLNARYARGGGGASASGAGHQQQIGNGRGKEVDSLDSGFGTAQGDAGDGNYDAIQAKAMRLVENTEAPIPAQFLQQLEGALALLPSGLQSRRLREAYNVLRARLQEQRASVQSKTGFAFSSKARAKQQQPAEPQPQQEKESDVAAAVEKDLTEEPAAGIQMARNKDSIFVTGKTNEVLHINGTANEEVTISDVSGCHLTIPFSASAVHLKNVHGSTLVFGAPIFTSILIRDCSTLRLVAAAQQIRIHNSHELTLHVAVRGAVIIEDCTAVRVAPYRMRGVDLGWVNENWRTVRDFNWLVAEVQSPNWTVMPEDEWKEFDIGQEEHEQ